VSASGLIASVRVEEVGFSCGLLEDRPHFYGTAKLIGIVVMLKGFTASVRHNSEVSISITFWENQPRQSPVVPEANFIGDMSMRADNSGKVWISMRLDLARRDLDEILSLRDEPIVVRPVDEIPPSLTDGERTDGLLARISRVEFGRQYATPAPALRAQAFAYYEKWQFWAVLNTLLLLSILFLKG
jgi:hypothetical protein